MSYGQNPYGQPGGQSYGPPGQQNPYGQPGQGQRPFGGPTGPYGQPQQGYPPQNPYGQPGQQQPYGQPNQYQQNPYGQSQPSAPAAQPSAQEPWRPAGKEATQAHPGPDQIVPIAQHAVRVHTLGDDPEEFVVRTLGEVIGVALRPKGNDVVALTKARQDAVARMAEMAEKADADAVIGLRFDSNLEEIVAYGTAVELDAELAAQPAGEDETAPEQAVDDSDHPTQRIEELDAEETTRLSPNQAFGSSLDATSSGSAASAPGQSGYGGYSSGQPSQPSQQAQSQANPSYGQPYGQQGGQQGWPFQSNN